MKMNRNMDRGIIALQLLIRHWKGKPQHNWIPTIAGSECKIFFSLDSHIGVVERWPNEVVNVRYATASSPNVDKNKHPPNLCAE